MFEAYLTIDDSPSPRTGILLEFLKSRNIQALFFCRGDFMEKYPKQVEQIVRHGHVLGNHLYSHQPASILGVENVKQEILKTEHLIQQAYDTVNIKKPGSFLRFPYLDRGDGQKNEQKFSELVKLVQNGSSAPLEISSEVAEIQAFLEEHKYYQPFKDITHPLYTIEAIRNARDSLLTYTSYDWMLSPRHKGNHAYKTVEDLKEKIDKDDHLLLKESVNIVLFHDDREGIIDEVCDLIDHMINKGIKFRDYFNE